MNRETVQSVQSPAGWKSGTLGTFGQFKGGSGFPIRYQGRTEGYYPFIKVSDFSHPQNKDGITTANHFIDKQTLKAIGAKVHISGSIVFAKIGAALFLERKRRLFVECCIDNNMMSYSVDEAIGDPQFFHVLFNSIRLSDAAAASALPVLSTSDLRDIEFCCPPLPEQQAIAKALGDVDGLIASLEDLIAKKRDIKQGAMQELLSGHRRLPGFKGEWEKQKLGACVEIRNTKVQTRNNPLAETCIELEQIETVSGVVTEFLDATERYTSKYHFWQKDVLFGRLRPYLRKFWFATCEGVCSTEIWPLYSPKGIVVQEFLFHVVQTDQFIAAASAAYGTHMPRADWRMISDFILALPPTTDEQFSIAMVLFDMDAEIVALQAKLAKTRDVKQGMMQVLLTGEVRLI
jgi:type I restriction enzyme, S subunit